MFVRNVPRFAHPRSLRYQDERFSLQIGWEDRLRDMGGCDLGRENADAVRSNFLNDRIARFVALA